MLSFYLGSRCCPLRESILDYNIVECMPVPCIIAVHLYLISFNIHVIYYEGHSVSIGEIFTLQISLSLWRQRWGSHIFHIYRVYVC